jgi:glycine dehydrogenase
MLILHDRVHRNDEAAVLRGDQRGVGELMSDSFIDTVSVRVPAKAHEVITAAEARGINLRLIDAATVGVSVDETTTAEVLSAVVVAFGAGPVVEARGFELPGTVLRTS